MAAARRPNPFLWVWYAFGGRLPERYRDWVLHDVTCRTWVLRHAIRTLVQISPGLLFLLLPGPLWIRAMAVLGGVILALWYSLSYVEHTSEYRLTRHGFAMGTGRATREAAQAAVRAERADRYAAIYRNRAQG
ncbi:hypothetical protein GCM10011581_14740 [Saccharopolyspora subtropica]|uniref:DUF5313 domain-containing protein n=1 Tax=Saccharopolyspora thermophila TaxID=89367 RepID=A0A917JRF0_9PSEU|nr:DUF5313 family protein [Saccharopolyspora subtropica]GGI78646.1 hypothetical protein GCM10011581_14740 [Saccharopolyspora subtropica]